MGYVERVLGVNFRPDYLKTEAAAPLENPQPDDIPARASSGRGH